MKDDHHDYNRETEVESAFERRTLDALEWIKRETSDTARYAHKAMWYSAVAMVIAAILLLRAGGFL